MGQGTEGGSEASPLLSPAPEPSSSPQSYWDLHAVPMHNREGRVAELLVLVNDVTQRYWPPSRVEELDIQMGAGPGAS